MKKLLPCISDWFLPKKEYFVAFADADSRIEGWFKAEMIVLLNRLMKQGIVKQFEREFKISRQTNAGVRSQIDFRIQLGRENHLCELKALCISQAAGTPRNLQFYFRDDKVGFICDLKKLDALPSQDKKWALGFVYPSPEPTKWQTALTSLTNELGHWRCVTKPSDFREYLFISLWKQDKKRKISA